LPLLLLACLHVFTSSPSIFTFSLHLFNVFFFFFGPCSLEPNRTSANSSTLTDALFTVLRARTPASFTSLFNDLETRLKPRFLALETRLTHLKWSKYLQDKTGVNATYWTVGGGLLAAAVFRIMLHIAASLVSNIVGFVYPAYASIKSIEGGDKEENSHWLTYWTVFGSFSVAEYFSGFILRWIPFYYTGKIALLVWCMHPRTRFVATPSFKSPERGKTHLPLSLSFVVVGEPA